MIIYGLHHLFEKGQLMRPNKDYTSTRFFLNLPAVFIISHDIAQATEAYFIACITKKCYKLLGQALKKKDNYHLLLYTPVV